MNKKLKISTLTATLIVSLVFGQNLGAQNKFAPLIILKSGELWSWMDNSPGLQQMTHSGGYISKFSLSPDGKNIAYTIYSPATIAWLKSGGEGEGRYPEDIWLLNLDSHSLTQVASQTPDQYSILAPMISFKRSVPQWSPASDLLAWTEGVTKEPEGTVIEYHLAIYNIDKRSKIVAKLTANNWPSAPVWGEPGILISMDNSLYLYSAAETQLEVLPDLGQLFVWAKIDQKYYVLARSTIKDDNWNIIDLSGPNVSMLEGSLSLFSSRALTGLSISTKGSNLENWSVIYPDTTIVGINADIASLISSGISFPASFAISPDGDSVAFTNVDGVYIYNINSNKPVIISEINNGQVAWGTVEWLIQQ